MYDSSMICHEIILVVWANLYELIKIYESIHAFLRFISIANKSVRTLHEHIGDA